MADRPHIQTGVGRVANAEAVIADLVARVFALERTIAALEARLAALEASP